MLEFYVPRKYLKYETVVQKAEPLNLTRTETHQKYIPEVLGARKNLLLFNQQFQQENDDAAIPEHDLISATNNRKISHREESNRGDEVHFFNDLSEREGTKTLI